MQTQTAISKLHLADGAGHTFLGCGCYAPTFGSRSIRSCPFSRRNRATSAAKSDGDGDDACVVGRRDAPVACVPNCVIHRRSTV